MTDSITMIPVGAISADPNNPRESIDKANLKDLAASIRSIGLVEPLVVRTNGSDDTYVLIAGHRRLAAIELINEQDGGMTIAEVQSIVRDTDDAGAAIAQLVENLQRVDLDPIEEAKGFARLQTFDMKQKDVAVAVGKSAAYVSRRLKLLTLPPEAFKHIRSGDLALHDAEQLADLEDTDTVASFIEHGFSSWQLRNALQDQELRQKRDKVVAKIAKQHPDLLVVSHDNWGPIEEKYPAEFHQHREGGVVALDELDSSTPPEHAVGLQVYTWGDNSEVRWALAKPLSKTHDELFAKITEALESGDAEQITAAQEALTKFREKREAAAKRAEAKRAAANPHNVSRDASPEAKAAAKQARANERAAKEHKADFLAHLVAKAQKGVLVPLILRWMAIHEVNQSDEKHVCRFLGLEPDTAEVPKQRRWDAKEGKYVTPEGTRTQRDFAAPIRRYLAEGGERALLKVATASLFSRLSQWDYGVGLKVGDDEVYGNFAEWLAEQGFEPLDPTVSAQAGPDDDDDEDQADDEDDE